MASPRAVLTSFSGAAYAVGQKGMRAMYAPPSLPPLPPPPRRYEVDLWLMLAIMSIMLMLLFAATAVMMAIGGVFLPFGFNSDFFARLLPPAVLVSLGVVILLVVGTVVIVTAVRMQRQP
jgi:hypothetical protein